MSGRGGASVRLRKPLEGVLGAGHPWVYRDATDGSVDPEAGSIVDVLDTKGRFLARGIADEGPIAVRLWTTRDEPVDARLFSRRIAAASALREQILPAETDAFRLLNGEGDRTPGFVCDVYDRYAVLRVDGAGATAHVDAFIAALRPVLDARGVLALLVRHGRRAERGIEPSYGEVPREPVAIRERGMTLLVDLWEGQKTGLFLDHRESRHYARSLVRGERVLNLYGYTGGFSVACGLGGARAVTTVDIAPRAIELASRTWGANGLDPALHRGEVADVLDFVKGKAKSIDRYGLVVCDPPSFAPNEASLETALATYRALHVASLKLVKGGGLYLAASCSSHVDREAFDRTLVDAARDAGSALQILDRHGAPADHPRLAVFPEGDYLKVTLARVLA